MPTSIPVQVGQQQFDSMNKARLHYREILYRYETGHAVDDADKSQVMSLLECAAIGAAPQATEDAVRVVKGNYGRRCFEVRRENEPGHLISIMRAVKECIAERVLPKSHEKGA
ncbi:hypothetical protein ACIGHN_02330 [Acidovorax sp. NPDC077693]|uniref:hypothetical protein n=1 Tax=unclassified Acidovorax TaxID=2684926 RepID=UPI0037C57B65